jgi:hypothetical protein
MSQNANGNFCARPAAARLGPVLLCAGLWLVAAPARAQPQEAQPAPSSPPAAEAQPHPTPAPGATAPPAAVQPRQGPSSAGKPINLSKFEARRVRHHCVEIANVRGFKGAERESFLTRCFFGRAATRAARRECTKQGVAKGLDKAALHDFVRECVKEPRARQ